MSFIEAFAGLKICLFRYLFSRNQAKHFRCSAVNNGLQAAMFTGDKELFAITFV